MRSKIIIYLGITFVLYKQALIPCNIGNHWVICHVILKKGEVHLYDSLWPRNGNLELWLKDIRCLLYLLPSILKHSGYYAEMKSDPHTNAFTATNINHTLIPQQNDGYCSFLHFHLHKFFIPLNNLICLFNLNMLQL